MREIMFRAWSLTEKKMYHNVGITPDGWVFAKEGSKEVGLGDNGVDCVLMQYTGLEDKNGKEIYEGDIVHSGLLYRVVVFDNYKWMLVGKDYSYDEELYKVYRAAHFGRYDFVVVGNVFENPELVKRYQLEWVVEEHFK